MTDHKTLFDFSSQVVCVTGASSPIGAAIARRFFEAGADLVLHYHTNPGPVTALAEELSETPVEGKKKPLCVKADLSDPSQVGDMFGVLYRERGRLDVLVNNAGLYPVTGILDMSEEEWRGVIGTNLSGLHFCTKEAAFLMKTGFVTGATVGGATESGKCGRGGAIINISSIEAERPGYGHSHYTASKAGVVGYTKAAAQELGPAGIRVNVLLPGLINRPGLNEDWPEGVAAYSAAAPLKRLGEGRDVADACLFFASPGAAWITGAVLHVDGGVSAARGY